MRSIFTTRHVAVLAAGVLVLVAAESSSAGPRGGRIVSSYGRTGFQPYYNPAYGPLPSYYNYNYHPYYYGYGVNTYPYYYGGYSYGSGYPAVQNNYTYNTYPQPNPSVVTTQSMYPPQQVTPQPATATLDVSVPANAEVWIQGRKTAQTGTLRRFVTPPLKADVDSSYEIRVRWTENGEVYDKTREVNVEPGKQVLLNFAK